MQSKSERLLRKFGIIMNSLPTKTMISRGALFHGDIPREHRSQAIGQLDTVGSLPDGSQINFICSQEYVAPRPNCSVHKNVTYTAAGNAWVGPRIDTSLSARDSSFAGSILKDRLHIPGAAMERATLVQSQFPNTYGDWTSEHMKSIALCPDFPRPLVLSAEFSNRSYVKSELGRLGIEYITIDRPILIREATVLHKPRPTTLWNKDDAAAYRRLFGIVPPKPRPGSILYLSRQSVASEQKKADRDYRSDIIARIVTSLGGKVIKTANMTFSDFSDLAGEAETVIGDHGAALFNILQWETRNLIEIVTDNWWSRCFVFLGASCGVANHAVVRCDGRSEAELHDLLAGHLTSFGAEPSPQG
jgi:hypothetical protein